MKMKEFLLWSNCSNRCDFCWQCKINDKETILNEEEMISCIQLTCNMLDDIKECCDVLLVGGEILNSYYNSVDKNLCKLIDKCLAMVKEGKIRYLYVNTNLIYSDRVNLSYLLQSFIGYESRLKFTTSFDVYERFHTEKAKQMFLSNLAYIRDNFRDVNVVVNTIITKQLMQSDFDFDEFAKEYRLKYINFVPYIPVEDDREMDVTFKDIVKVLAYCEKKHKGYIDFYIKDFDYNQNKVLYEYRKGKGYIECTSRYSECHHNDNFKKVLNGECYICKLKEVFC